MLFKNICMYWTIRKVVKAMNDWDLQDIESEKYKNISWEESDGWRTASFSQENNRFYFNDFPEKTFTRSLDAILEMEYHGK
jgi:hypothetical protein